jgi:hypothetical protein
MKTDTTDRDTHLESMLWRNELECNRRELAIFESYLLNKGGRIQPHALARLMGQLHQHVQSVNKLLDEIRTLNRRTSLTTQAELADDYQPHTHQPYIREEMFYFEQSYRQFKHSFRSFAEGLEVA